jgi:2-haloacid dehalogenase
VRKYKENIALSPSPDPIDQRELVLEKFPPMPPHPEVPTALQKLRDAGFRLFTLTDNLLVVQTRQLELLV